MIGGLLVLVGLVGLGFWQFSQVNKQLKLENQTLRAELNLAKQNLASTSDLLVAEQAKTQAVESQIQNIASTVGTLDKLSKTDKELLKKYSKISFLNEHYVPAQLATVTPELVFEPNRPQSIHAGIHAHLENMLEDASSSKNNLLVISAYRSFKDQKALKTRYLVTYGTGANKFSADQGYSEHQLGTTVDLTTASLGANYEKLAGTKALAWLEANAYRYGFIMSYTHDNTYYRYEPWHWRFVGVSLATKLHNEKLNFYDWPQRLIDQYLVNFFD